MSMRALLTVGAAAVCFTICAPAHATYERISAERCEGPVGNGQWWNPHFPPVNGSGAYTFCPFEDRDWLDHTAVTYVVTDFWLDSSSATGYAVACAANYADGLQLACDQASAVSGAAGWHNPSLAHASWANSGWYAFLWIGDNETGAPARYVGMFAGN